MRAARRTGWLIVIGLCAAPELYAADYDCLAAASAALDARAPARAIAAVDRALADTYCTSRALDLEMLRALALHDLARAEDGQAWCRARDAYAGLRASADSDYAVVARRGYAETDEACRQVRHLEASLMSPDAQPPTLAPTGGEAPGLASTADAESPTRPLVDAPRSGHRSRPAGPVAHDAPPPESRQTDHGPMTLLISGLGVAAVGGGLLVAGAIAHSDLRFETPDSTRHAAREGVAEARVVHGATVAGVGVAMALGGAVWLLVVDETDLAPAAGPGSIGVQGRF